MSQTLLSPFDLLGVRYHSSQNMHHPPLKQKIWFIMSPCLVFDFCYFDHKFFSITKSKIQVTMFFWKYCLFLLFSVLNYIFSFVNCGLLISCKVNVPACPLKPEVLWSCRPKHDAKLSRKNWLTFLMVYLFTKVSNKLLLGNHHLDTFKIFIFLPDSDEYFAQTVQAFLPFCILHFFGFIGQFSHQHQLLLFSVIQLDFHYASISSFKIFSELMFQNSFSTHWFCILCMYKQKNNQLRKTDQSIN